MIFNITVTFTGIYRRMFTEDKLYIRVTKVKDIYRIFVLKKNTDIEETKNDKIMKILLIILIF